MLFIGVDCGTQSTKVIVYDAETESIISRAAATYPSGVISDRSGQAEQHPEEWVQAVKTAVRSALQGCGRASAVRGIAVSGQQHGLVLLDRQGQVIRPCKLWCDLESAAEAEELSKQFGLAIVPSFTITKLLWTKRNDPESWARVAHVMLPHDYINYWLTGFFTMEASDASGTGLLDPTQRCWDSARLEAVGEPQLMEWLPARLLAPNEPAGKLKPEIASQLGLPQGLDVTVGPGGGDNAMAALGCGAVREGAMVLSLGTSGTLFGAAPQPVIDLSGAICPFCDATGRALPLLCTINCCSVVEEVRRLFNLDHEAMAELIAEEPVGCHGVTMLPYLAGERTPNWPTATGTILGLRPGLLRSGVLARAAMEGVTFSLLSGLRVMESYGLRINELRVVGGGSKNASWRRIITDAFQLPLTFPIEPEAAAFGAALQAAAVTAGTAISDFIEHHPPMMEKEVLYPNPKHAEEYNISFQRFQDLGHTLFS